MSSPKSVWHGVGLIIIAMSLDEILKGAGKLIAFSLVALYPYLSEKFKMFWKNRTNYMGYNVKVRTKIKFTIAEIRANFKGARACLFEFSNTEKSIAGYPFEYMTMSYEITDGVTVDIKDSWQKKNINMHLDFLDGISEKETRYLILQLNTDLPDPVREHMLVLHLKSCIIFKVTSQLVTGYIAVHFVENKYPGDRLSREDEDYLKMQAAKIHQLMRSLK